jgi:membrane protein implicated in regulation of membrane protease activity
MVSDAFTAPIRCSTRGIARWCRQRGIVCEAIRNGEGKVRLGDGVWLAAGPDMPEGTPVVVDGVHGTKLHVNALAARNDAEAGS